MREHNTEEAIRRAQREQRRAKLWQERKRRHRRNQALLGAVLLLAVAVMAAAVFAARQIGRSGKGTDAQTSAKTREEKPSSPEEKPLTFKPDASMPEPEEDKAPQEPLPFAKGYEIEASKNAAAIREDLVTSKYAILVDLDANAVVAQRNAYERINPASMTKILTVLAAAEHISDRKDTFTVTREMTDYSYKNDCSAAGFADGETVTVEDLMYGTILPSGADAAAGLAYYVSGSLEGFTALMNEKLSELGLSDTAHFTNCVGLYDESHYCTVYDMAVLLKAAVENEWCKEALSARKYTTSPTEQHPQGIELSNWFLRRIEDKDTKGEVVCAKTGYVAQSGNCAASYLESDSGRHYICVTVGASSGWRCIYDHVAVYQEYVKDP